MDDDLEASEAGLGTGTSAFHKLGKGMVAFLRATLGFEQDVMREGRDYTTPHTLDVTDTSSQTASERLADAEAVATADNRRAQHDPQAFHSSIYPSGSEYALCHAQTQLMAAVVGVLNESLTESIKGFYKLRRAYITLDGILSAEAKYMKRRQGLGLDTPAQGSVDSLKWNHSATPSRQMPGGFASGHASREPSRPPSAHSTDEAFAQSRDLHPSRLERIDTGVTVGGGEDHNQDNGDSDVFYDADENFVEDITATYTGKVEMNGVTSSINKASIRDDNVEAQALDLPTPKLPINQHDLLDHDPDSDIFSNPLDVFIHSGANLCFGLLNIMLSMIPPSFGRLLFIIGFHGDKERGVRMLWQASKFHNLNGAFAGLIVLGFYNTLIGFSDIIPESDANALAENPIDGYPKERCEALLAEMRRRHPKSHLWLLEEARMNAFNRNLSRSIHILENASKSRLKQVEALEMFEKSLNAMYSHRYELCSMSFISCLTLNNWSPALYNYIAGSAHVELYRLLKASNPAEAKKHATKATELLKATPQHAGKKKFMARQLPFDVFVTRKIKKWESRAAQDLKCSFIDAVGISPIEEMIFFWNGYKRMDSSQLEDSLNRLKWTESSANPQWQHDVAAYDEKAILAVLRAATLRNLDRLDEAEAILKKEVLAVDKTELKGGLKDDWTAPAAHYEMGVLCWARRKIAAEDGSGPKEEERWVKECEGWVGKAAKWEGYDLDARLGLKIATAQDTLKRWKEKREIGKS
ncbi:uncharacterized protein KY384_002037 [Bacidia gigantensis]|uniref:uncharacterized protein n=1 Tax=Bacidia gigantensis TaxID=2732470 RepID=UPI001D044BBD|nr:uncharacterized protein KY384_002037 [Bacidia gigantensis]KAG8533254.1 hypothetical protein KY384_002037 [Bacidia gigantensis]